MTAYKHKTYLLLVILQLALLTGCVSHSESDYDPFFEAWKDKVDSSRASSPSRIPRQIEESNPVEEVIIPEITVEKTEKQLPKDFVTMKMYNTDVNVILRSLARISDQNIMMNASVTGVTNINVKNTAWDQVFTGLLRTRGLVFKWEGDIIRVMTLEDLEHDQNLEKVQQEQKAQQLEGKKVEPLETRIVKVNYSDAASLAVNMERILASQDSSGNLDSVRGSVMVDEHNNALVIHAIRDDISELITLVELLDQPTPQILIEAHIVETSRQTAQELGIQWGGLYYKDVHDASSWITSGANAGGVLGETLQSGISQSGINPTTGLAADFPADFTKNTRGTGGMTLGFVSELLGEYLINVQLSALEASSKLNILSSPSITTLDNQVAIVESGTEVPFQTIDNETGNPEVEFRKAVLKLDVTPHVIDEKLLKLKIVINKDELDFTRTVNGNPTIITKNIETNIILQDGQTTVIGGLTKETISGSEAGAPGLKDIPGLGYLFKGQGKQNEMEEVLIFLTPRILKEQES